MIKGIFVNEDEYPYARWIVEGRKWFETRSRNMLKNLAYERIAIVRTKRGEPPMVVGYAFMWGYGYEDRPWLYRELTMIPEGSKHDTRSGRWFYGLAHAEKCEPYPLHANAIRHGRSWCEWENN